MSDKIANRSEGMRLSNISPLDSTSASSSRLDRGPRVGGFAKTPTINNVPFSGYSDIQVSLPLVELTNEDLNDIIEPGTDYKANMYNSCDHRPTNVESFGLKIIDIGNGAIAQQLIESNNGKQWFRIYKDSTWTNWEYLYSSANPQTIPASVEYAMKLVTARKINITGVVEGSGVFDGSKDITIDLPHASHIGDDNDYLVFTDGNINFGGTNSVTSVYIGNTSIGDRKTPTDYYFGAKSSANVHANNFFIGNTNISDIYSRYDHNHDDVYAKKDHTHTVDDLNLPSTLPNPYALVIKYNGVQYGSYDGTTNMTINVTPDAIGAALADHDHGKIIDTSNNIDSNNTPGTNVGKMMSFEARNNSAIGIGGGGATSAVINIQPSVDSDEATYQLGFAFSAGNPNNPVFSVRSGKVDESGYGAWRRVMTDDRALKTSGLLTGTINDLLVRAAAKVPDIDIGGGGTSGGGTNPGLSTTYASILNKTLLKNVFSTNNAIDTKIIFSKTNPNIEGEPTLVSDTGNVNYKGKAYAKKDTANKILYIYPDYDNNVIYAPIDSSELFCPSTSNGFAYNSIEFSNFNTSKVTNMNYMFNGLQNITTLDLSGFDTSNVTNMSNMFTSCTNMININLSSFNTANVLNMSRMFYNCNKLSTLYISNFDTSKVLDMSSMFNICSSLTIIEFDFDTSSVMNMNSMFYRCNALSSLNISGWDVSNVNNMNSMFNECSKLINIDLSNWKTNNVTDMQYLFNKCTSLVSVDLSNWINTNTVNMQYLFANCSSLSIINLTNFNTSKAITMQMMFNGCTKLNTLNGISGFNTSNVTNMTNMFGGCESLSNIDVSNFDISKITALGQMFINCKVLSTLDISNWDMSNILSTSYMLSGTGLLNIYVKDETAKNKITATSTYLPSTCTVIIGKPT